MTVNEDPQANPRVSYTRTGGVVLLLDLRSTPVSGKFCGGFLSFCLSAFLVVVTSLFWPVRERISPSCPLRARVLVQTHREDEISRRGGVFYVGLTTGTLTAGLLQSAATTHLDGLYGLAGWRWMFIINAIITLGPFIWPGTPDKLKSFFLSEEEVQQARTRLERAGHAHSSDLSWSKVGAMFMNWKSYPLGHLLLER
jgi:MFS family permease